MMTKLLIALSTVFLFAMALVANRPTQALAAPLVTEPAPPSVGSCRFFCGNDPTPFMTRAACQAACSTVCEAVC